MICKDNIGFKELKSYISTFEDKKSSLIIVLHKAQEIFGYIPAEVQEFIAEELEVPVAKVYGVVSFYNFFSMEPKGKYQISVCTGTACYVRGAGKVLESLEKELNIEELAREMAKAILANNQAVLGKKDTEKAIEKIDEEGGEKDVKKKKTTRVRNTK